MDVTVKNETKYLRKQIRKIYEWLTTKVHQERGRRRKS